ncbi:hypothetical protein LTR27_010049 [Elasticomyces elasticus]|nr:hypothetical protein LTR27_010049 [Elasticomyces elasticus]
MAGIQGISVTTIARNGDVVLTICTPPTTKLRVSSDILTGASTVFAAMLGPHFREGQTRRNSVLPAQISLPDDDAGAMSDLCSLLHGQPTPELVGRVPVERVYRLAVAVDKYACIERLQLHGQALLLGYLEMHVRAGFADLGRAAAAALLLKHPRAFAIATKRLVMETTKCYTQLFTKEIAHVIPPTVLLSLEAKRVSAQNDISHSLPKLGMSECHGPLCSDCGCSDCGEMSDEEDVKCDNWDAEYADKLCKAFDISYWPPNFRGESALTISNAVQNIRKLGTAQRKAPTCAHTGSFEEVDVSEFLAVIRRVEKQCEGSCLKCVTDGVLDLSKPCQTKKAHA